MENQATETVTGGSTPAQKSSTLDSDIRLTYWQNNPVAFMRDVLDFHPYGKQAEVAESVAKNRRTTCASCPSAGKTQLAAALSIWFFVTHYPAKVITTAPTNRQVEHQLWSHIRSFVAQSQGYFGGSLLTKSWKHPKNPEHFALGFSTRAGESEGVTSTRAQGWHSPNLLLVIDEASGVPEFLISTLSKMLMTGSGARMLMIGNATASAGTFVDAHTGVLEGYNSITIEADDTPNVKAGKELIPGLVTKEWVDDFLREVGTEDNILYRSLVKAIFPKDDPQGLIPMTWVEAAEERWLETERRLKEPNYPELSSPNLKAEPPEPEEIEPLMVLCDPGRSPKGDPTAFLWRRGNRVLKVERYMGLATTETTARLKAEAVGGALIGVDPIGVGVGVYDQLRTDDLSVIAINFGEAAKGKDKTGKITFINRRAESYWRLREALDPNGEILLEIPKDNKLRFDLTAPKWFLTQGGKVKIESKDDIRKRLNRSTDTGDCAAMSCVMPSTVSIIAGALDDDPHKGAAAEIFAHPERFDKHDGAGDIFNPSGMGTIKRSL